MAYRPRVFDKNVPVYVRKSFKGNGRNWIVGQRFDWRYLGVSIYRVKQMVSSGFLQHAEHEDEELEQVPVEPQDISNYIEDAETTETTELTSDLEPKQAGYTLQSRGGPYYDVISPDGEAINDKALFKKDALALIEEKTDGFPQGDEEA